MLLLLFLPVRIRWRTLWAYHVCMSSIRTFVSTLVLCRSPTSTFNGTFNRLPPFLCLTHAYRYENPTLSSLEAGPLVLPHAALALNFYLLKNLYFYMLKLISIEKLLTFDKNFIFLKINLKTILSTKSFNKTFGYLIDLAILLT